MSTATQSTLGFAEASVEKLPSYAYIGYVSDVGEGKLASTENYVVQPFTLTASTTGRQITDRWLYRPEWLEADFNPNSIIEEFGEAGENMLKVYRNHLAVKGGISKLKGLCGSEQNYINLSAALISAPDHNIPTVQQICRDFFLSNEDQAIEVGYVLKQKRDKTGDVDENGRAIYALAKGYEVGEYFFPDDAGKKRMRMRAKNSKEGKDGFFRIAFDEDSE